CRVAGVRGVVGRGGVPPRVGPAAVVERSARPRRRVGGGIHDQLQPGSSRVRAQRRGLGSRRKPAFRLSADGDQRAAALVPPAIHTLPPAAAGANSVGRTMPDLKLTLACWDYGRTRALIDGRVKPKGIDLEVEILRPRQTFQRMLDNKEFEVSELSLASYTALKGRGACPFVAVPVALSKIFRHSCIYV